MSSPSLIRFILIVAPLAAIVAPLRADKNVVVIARANPDYEQARTGEDGQPKPQSYVFMEGNHYKGHTVDRSIERMTFREIAGFLAPELAKRQYFPGPSAEESDLLLLVHWGTTLPKVGLQEMTAQVTQDIDHNHVHKEMMDAAGVTMDVEGAFDGLPQEMTMGYGEGFQQEQDFDRLNELTDDFSQQSRNSTNVALLGYADELHRLGKRSWTSELERSLRYDLNKERYFIIIKAYELKSKTPSVPGNRPVWTMHLNISSPGNNFQSALDRMSKVAALFAGQTTAEVKTVRPKITTGTVKLAPLIILKPKAEESR